MRFAAASVVLSLLRTSLAVQSGFLAADGEEVEAESAERRRRPIITGCLEECGTEDQSCVTQCEVCVEQQACADLQTNCSTCFDEAQEMKADMRRWGNVGSDSGGPALAHEAIRQRHDLARLQAMDGTHRLRGARDHVLQAQRGVEWAAEETREEENRLASVERHLEETKADARRWSERSQAKLAELRENRTDCRGAVKRTLKQLRVAERKLEDAQKELAEAKDLAHAGVKIRKVLITARVVTRLDWKVRKQRQQLVEAKQAYKKQQRDSTWFQRGLQKEVKEVDVLVEKQEHKLDEAHDLERNSRKLLQGSKDEYRAAAARRQNLTTAAAKLQRLLLAHPLPNYVPPELRDGEDEEDGILPSAPAGVIASIAEAGT